MRPNKATSGSPDAHPVCANLVGDSLHHFQYNSAAVCLTAAVLVSSFVGAIFDELLQHICITKQRLDTRAAAGTQQAHLHAARVDRAAARQQVAGWQQPDWLSGQAGAHIHWHCESPRHQSLQAACNMVRPEQATSFFNQPRHTQLGGSPHQGSWHHQEACCSCAQDAFGPCRPSNPIYFYVNFAGASSPAFMLLRAACL